MMLSGGKKGLKGNVGKGNVAMKGASGKNAMLATWQEPYFQRQSNGMLRVGSRY